MTKTVSPGIMKIAKIFENQSEVLDEGKVDEGKINKVKQMRNAIEEMMGDKQARSKEKEKTKENCDEKVRR